LNNMKEQGFLKQDIISSGNNAALVWKSLSEY
jgi:hypothetical protein